MEKKRRVCIKINWPVLTVLSAVVLASAAAVHLARQRADPAVFAAQAKALLAAGQPGLAIEAFQQALRRQENNREWMLRCAEAVRHLPPLPLDEALHYTDLQVRMLERLLQFDPGFVPAQRALLEFDYAWAETINDDALWERIYIRSVDVIAAEKIIGREPVPEVRRFRLLADARRNQTLAPEEADRQLQQPLLDWLKKSPGDEAVMAQWIRYHRLMRPRRIAISTRAGATQVRQALDAAADFLEVHPQAAEVRMEYIRLLFDTGAKQEAVRQLEELDRQLPEVNDRALLLKTAALNLELAAAGDEKLAVRREAARQLLLRLTEAFPGDYMVRMYEAEWLRMAGDDEASEALLGRIRRQEFPIRPGVQARIAANLIPAAGGTLINRFLDRAEAAGAAGREAWMVRIRPLLKELREVGRSDGLLELIDGRIALMEGRNDEAVALLAEADRKYRGRSLPTVHLLAQALVRNGESGAAYDRFRQVLAHPAGRTRPEAHAGLAECLILQGRPSRALRWLREAGRELGTLPELKASELQAMEAEGRMVLNVDPAAAYALFEEALAAAEKGVWPDAASAGLMQARLLRHLNRESEAWALLRQLQERYPDCSDVLHALVEMASLHDRTADTSRRLEKWLVRYPMDVEAAVALAGISLSAPQLAWIEERVLNAPGDFYPQALVLARLYQGKGASFRAERFLARAVEMRPEGREAQRLLFEQSLRVGNQRLLERLLEAARRNNLDLASGDYWRGRAALAEGRPVDALSALGRAASALPLFSEVWKTLGDARLQTGQLNEAANAYERALQIRPQYVEVLERLFELRDRQGRYAEALALLGRRLQVSMNQPALREAYLYYLAEHGDPLEARRARQRIADREPENLENLRALARLQVRTGRFAEAEILFERLLEEQPGRLAEVLLFADLRQIQGQPDDGVRLLEDYIRRRGEQAVLQDHLALAVFLAENGRNEAADAQFRRTLALEVPGRALAHRAYGTWLELRGEPLLAAYQFQAAHEADDGERDLLRAAVLLIEAGSLVEGEQAVGESVARYGESVETRLLKALLAERRRDFRAAESEFNGAVEADPFNPRTRFQRGAFYARRNTVAYTVKAEADLGRAVEAAPDFIAARELLAWLAEEQGGDRIQGAVAQYVEIIAQQPGYLPAWTRLARIYVRQKEQWRLDTLLDQAERQFPDYPLWARLRSAARRSDGDGAQALQLLAEQFRGRPSALNLAVWLETLNAEGRFRETIERVAEQPGLLRESARVKAALAAASRQTGDERGARQLFRAALRQAGGDESALAAVLLQLRDSSSPDECIELLEQEFQQAFSVPVLIGLASLYSGAGQFDQAIGLLRTALERRLSVANREWIETRLGAVFTAAGRVDEAIEHYRRTVDREPEQVLALNNLAYLYSECKNNPQVALPFARRAVEVGSANPRVRAALYDTLGRVHNKLGNYEQAAYCLNRSLNLHDAGETRKLLEEVQRRVEPPSRNKP